MPPCRSPQDDAILGEICAFLRSEVERVVRAELAADQAARKQDSETLADVRKIIARLRIGTDFNPRRIEHVLWATNALLLSVVIAIAVYARII